MEHGQAQQHGQGNGQLAIQEYAVRANVLTQLNEAAHAPSAENTSPLTSKSSPTNS
jgi:hypothetical protein